jgi:pheromone shutdown protein TraB
MMDKDWGEMQSEFLQAGVKDLLDPFIWLRRICELPLNTVAELEAFKRIMCVWLTIDGLDPLWVITKAMEEEPELFRYMQQWASPNYKKALLDDREEYMSQRIKQYAEQHNSIIAATGLLHMKALHEKLSREGLQVESISVLDL